jgi:hypothetical protein
MAYNAQGLKLMVDGGSIAGSGYPNPASCKSIYSYVTNDDAETVEADGYFDGIANDPLVAGDIILAALDIDGSPTARTYVVSVGGGDVTVVPSKGGAVYIPFVIGATELSAGTPTELIAPCAGRIARLRTTVQAAIVTGGAVTVDVNTVAVDGLSITVADSATVGTRQTDTPTAGHATAVVAAGDRIEIIPAAAFNGGGALAGVLEILPV